ncbi:MAG: amidase [Acidimicrobiales bacterium]
MTVSDEKIRELSALELGARIGAGVITSTAVVEAHLRRIAAVNPELNAITCTLDESALEAAAAADSRIAGGAARGPLDGVPFTSKENIDCIGAATTEGLVVLAGNRPVVDAPVVERMRAAGAIPIARTNMPDLGLRVHTDNALHGPTLNPWNPTITCGGSSGGEGVAVATGMSPMGIGNDIGGSLRNPAYCSGIVAHKPTPHRLPRAASTPPTSWGPAKQFMSVNGPMTRTVADAHAMFEIMHGRHTRDPWSVTTAFRERHEIERPRIAVMARPPGGSTDDDIATGVLDAADRLARRGYDVVEAAPPDVDDVARTWMEWLGGELDSRRAVIDDLLAPDARRVLDLMHEMVGSQDLDMTIDAVTRRHAHAQAWNGFFAETPVLLAPVWTTPPFTIGADTENRQSVERIFEALRVIVAPNVLGLPATAVPIGTSNEAIPLGVQIISTQHADDVCLAVAADLEEEIGPITPIDPKA